MRVWPKAVSGRRKSANAITNAESLREFSLPIFIILTPPLTRAFPDARLMNVYAKRYERHDPLILQRRRAARSVNLFAPPHKRFSKAGRTLARRSFERERSFELYRRPREPARASSADPL